jgi:hypothetical protein
MSSTEQSPIAVSPPISVFSKSISSVYPGFHTISDTSLYVIVFVVVGLGIAYIYRDYIFKKIREYTLQIYLGKPNEIHSVDSPEYGESGTLFNNTGDNESDYDTDTDI